MLSSLFGRRPRVDPPGADPSPFPMDRPLLRLGPHDAWTVRDACAGTQIFGDTGSGKTSGSGRSIALAMLRAGFGGLVLTVKSSETERWREYTRRTGRKDDLVVFSPESPHRFNFLEHERTRGSRGGGRTANLTELLVSAMSVGEAGSAGSRQDPFWDRAMRQLLRNTIDALLLAGEPLTLANIQRAIGSAPTAREDTEDERWRRESYLFNTLLAANEACENESDREDLRVTTNFWLDEYAAVMDERTRGNIITTFTTLADGFLRGDLRELFCTGLTIDPTWTFDGRVIVLDLPQKQFHELGQVAQVIWKLCWQREVESSDRGERSRPVFLWADEAQKFITPREPDFVQTVREHKAACVYLTQARSNYVHALGQSNTAAVESFLGVTKTKIFHCNGDPETNAWASKVIADDYYTRVTFSPRNEKKKPADVSHTRDREPLVHASEFARLRCGGPPHGKVDAILFQSGRRFRDGQGNIARLTFDQNACPKETTA